MKLISNTVRPEFISVILGSLIIICNNKLKYLAFLQYANLLAYITTILKMAYGRPRPYMSSNEVKAWETYAEYG